jgi:hypothetical protein
MVCWSETQPEQAGNWDIGVLSKDFAVVVLQETQLDSLVLWDWPDLRQFEKMWEANRGLIGGDKETCSEANNKHDRREGNRENGENYGDKED